MKCFALSALAAVLLSTLSSAQFVSPECQVLSQANKGAGPQPCIPHKHKGVTWTTCTPFSEEMPPLVNRNQATEGRSWCAVKGYERNPKQKATRTKKQKSWGVCFPESAADKAAVTVPDICFSGSGDTTSSPAASSSPVSGPTGTQQPTLQPDCDGKECSPSGSPSHTTLPTILPTPVPSDSPSVATSVPSESPLPFGATRAPTFQDGSPSGPQFAPKPDAGGNPGTASPTNSGAKKTLGGMVGALASVACFVAAF